MIKKALLSKNGHTLIEMVIVLMILSIVASLAIVSFAPIQRELRAKNFLELLESDLLYAQQVAISYGSNSTLLIYNSQRQYIVKNQSRNLISRPYDEDIEFIEGTLHLYDIAFLANGNIRKPGTIFVVIDQQRYRIVFLLGKGRFYIEKQ